MGSSVAYRASTEGTIVLISTADVSTKIRHHIYEWQY